MGRVVVSPGGELELHATSPAPVRTRTIPLPTWRAQVLRIPVSSQRFGAMVLEMLPDDHVVSSAIRSATHGSSRVLVPHWHPLQTFTWCRCRIVSTELHPPHWHYKGTEFRWRAHLFVIYPILVASVDPTALRSSLTADRPRGAPMNTVLLLSRRRMRVILRIVPRRHNCTWLRHGCLVNVEGGRRVIHGNERDNTGRTGVHLAEVCTRRRRQRSVERPLNLSRQRR